MSRSKTGVTPKTPAVVLAAMPEHTLRQVFVPASRRHGRGRYTESQKSLALLLCDWFLIPGQILPPLNKVANRTGIPVVTLRRWFVSRGTDPLEQALRQRQARVDSANFTYSMAMEFLAEAAARIDEMTPTELVAASDKLLARADQMVGLGPVRPGSAEAAEGTVHVPTTEEDDEWAEVVRERLRRLAMPVPGKSNGKP